MLDYLAYAAGEFLAYIAAFRSSTGADTDDGPDADAGAPVPPYGNPPALDAQATAEVDAVLLDMTAEAPPIRRRYG